MAGPNIDLNTARELLIRTAAPSDGFSDWLSERRTVLAAGATTVNTSMGPVQYNSVGRGPPVICLHGCFGGYDQAGLMGSFLVSHGLTVITPSRPGYLGTPISVGATAETQADATVALMDALQIRQAAIYGFSVGSLVAFQLGVRHPDRTTCIILTGVGAPKSQLPGYQLVDRLLKDDIGLDILPYGLDRLARENLSTVLDLFMDVDSTLAGEKRAQRARYILNDDDQRQWLIGMVTSLTPLSDRRDGSMADVEAVDPWRRYAELGQLAAFRPPMLIIDARLDNNGSYTETCDIAKQIPTAGLHTVEDSGHFIWLGVNTADWQAQMVQYLNGMFADRGTA